MKRGLLLAALAALPGAACDAYSLPAGRTTYGDTVHVHSVDPIHLDRGYLREVARIGSDGIGPESPETFFQEISAFDVAPDGSVVIADLRGDVRRFSRGGEFLNRISRSGRGPGETTYVVNLAVSAVGIVVTHDLETGRINRHTLEGEFLGQRRRPVGRPRYSRDGLGFTPDGGMWIGINPTRQAFGTGSVRAIYGRLVDRAIRDSVYLPPRLWEDCPVRSSPEVSRGWWEDIREPYVPKPKWYREGDLLAVGCPATYTFDVIRPDGAVLRISREWEQVLLEGQEEFFVESVVGIGGLPDERPAYHRIWLARDGRVWVWPSRPGRRIPVSQDLRERGAPATRWEEDPAPGLDLFTAEGRWLGRVTLPENWLADPLPGRKDPLFRGDTVWAATTDSLGVNYLSRFLVEWRSDQRPGD